MWNRRAGARERHGAVILQCCAWLVWQQESSSPKAVSRRNSGCQRPQPGGTTCTYEKKRIWPGMGRFPKFQRCYDYLTEFELHKPTEQQHEQAILEVRSIDTAYPASPQSTRDALVKCGPSCPRKGPGFAPFAPATVASCRDTGLHAGNGSILRNETAIAPGAGSERSVEGRPASAWPPWRWKADCPPS